VVRVVQLRVPGCAAMAKDCGKFRRRNMSRLRCPGCKRPLKPDPDRVGVLCADCLHKRAAKITQRLDELDNHDPEGNMPEQRWPAIAAFSPAPQRSLSLPVVLAHKNTRDSREN
jgi:hypothetical protein